MDFRDELLFNDRFIILRICKEMSRDSNQFKKEIIFLNHDCEWNVSISLNKINNRHFTVSSSTKFSSCFFLVCASPLFKKE